MAQLNACCNHLSAVLSASKSDSYGLQVSLDCFLLSCRSTKHATTGCTPAKLLMGRELRTLLMLIRPDLKTSVLNKQSNQKQNHDISAKILHCHFKRW